MTFRLLVKTQLHYVCLATSLRDAPKKSFQSNQALTSLMKIKPGLPGFASPTSSVHQVRLGPPVDRLEEGYPFFCSLFQGNPPQKKGKKALLEDLVELCFWGGGSVPIKSTEIDPTIRFLDFGPEGKPLSGGEGCHRDGGSLRHMMRADSQRRTDAQVGGLSHWETNPASPPKKRKEKKNKNNKTKQQNKNRQTKREEQHTERGLQSLLELRVRQVRRGLDAKQPAAPDFGARGAS